MVTHHVVVCAFALLLSTAIVFAHSPGQEYTYLNMFLRTDSSALAHLSDEHVSTSALASSRINAPFQTRARELRGRRLLHEQHESDEQEEQEEHEEHEEKEPQEDPQDGTDGGGDTGDADDETVELPGKSVRAVEPDDEAMEMEGEKKKAAHQNEVKHSDFQGISQEKDGEDLKRLSKMLMKVIKKYNIKSMADVPCRAHSTWMPTFLRHIAEDNPKFKYYCVDTNRAVLKAMRKRVTANIEADFVLRKFWKGKVPQADLLFSWSGLDNMKTVNVQSYLQHVGTERRHKLMLIGSHSGSLVRSSEGEKIARFSAGGSPINVREEPFLLKRPMRIISDLSKDGNDKQLYIYKPAEMSANW